MASQDRRFLSGGFVGRQQELADLKAALEDAVSGHGRLLMLVGEPGIGKTRTAQELAGHAETLGAQVLWGRCYEDEGAPPYWALGPSSSVLPPAADAGTATIRDGSRRGRHRRNPARTAGKAAQSGSTAGPGTGASLLPPL